MGKHSVLGNYGKNWYERLVFLALLLLGASLIFKDQYSTILMILLLALGIYKAFALKQPIYVKQFRPYFWIPLLLILPRIIGLLYGEWDNATKELLRSIPLLIVPLAFTLLANANTYKRSAKAFLYGAFIGIVVFAVICYTPVVSTMITQDQPLSYLLRWRYMNFNFTSPLDAHPAYVGLVVIWVIAHILFSKIVKSKWRIWLILPCFILLFQMVARNALIVGFLILVVYIVRSNHKWLQIASLATVLSLVLIVLFHPSTYLKEKFFYIFQEDASLTRDTRFGRLEASYDVFTQAPVFGPGPGTDNKMRMDAYLNLSQQNAHDKNYNAHNQFVEYLSTFGIFGFGCFIIALFMAFKLTYKNRDFVHLLLLAAIVLAMLTESILERSLGIKYMSILVGFILLNHLNQTNEDRVSHGRRP